MSDWLELFVTKKGESAEIPIHWSKLPTLRCNHTATLHLSLYILHNMYKPTLNRRWLSSMQLPQKKILSAVCDLLIAWLVLKLCVVPFYMPSNGSFSLTPGRLIRTISNSTLHFVRVTTVWYTDTRVCMVITKILIMIIVVIIKFHLCKTITH